MQKNNNKCPIDNLDLKLICSNQLCNAQLRIMCRKCFNTHNCNSREMIDLTEPEYIEKEIKPIKIREFKEEFQAFQEGLNEARQTIIKKFDEMEKFLKSKYKDIEIAVSQNKKIKEKLERQDFSNINENELKIFSKVFRGQGEDINQRPTELYDGLCNAMKEIQAWASEFCPLIKGNADSVLNYTQIQKDKNYQIEYKTLNGLKHGECYGTTIQNNKILLGNYYEGKKEGKWINLLFVSKDGLILCEEGKYVNNLQEGPFVSKIIDQQGEQEIGECNYERGNLQGNSLKVVEKIDDKQYSITVGNYDQGKLLKTHQQIIKIFPE